MGGKVLDIFYEEFIKLVPAYILKREEEKKEEISPSSKSKKVKKKKGYSDQENFSELIAFNDKKDKSEIELQDLEQFINQQFKHRDITEINEDSSDDEVDSLYHGQHKLPFIRR